VLPGGEHVAQVALHRVGQGQGSAATELEKVGDHVGAGLDGVDGGRGDGELLLI
jgi:hypothetical protein